MFGQVLFLFSVNNLVKGLYMEHSLMLRSRVAVYVAWSLIYYGRGGGDKAQTLFLSWAEKISFYVYSINLLTNQLQNIQIGKQFNNMPCPDEPYR